MNMTIKQNQTHAARGSDNLQLLTDGELDRVVGGQAATKIHVTEIVITKKQDSTSPLFF
jgi:hypothetical protein